MVRSSCLLSVIFLLFSGPCKAQKDSMRTDSVKIVRKIAAGTKEIVRSLDRTDDEYISPNFYNWTVMLQNSNYGEKYKLSNGRQTIEFEPNFTYKLGGYIGWRWLFIGYSFDIGHWFNHNINAPKRDWQLSLYSSRVGCDLFYRETGDNFRIKSISNIDSNVSNLNFDGLNVKMKGINLYYIFNYKHFSYPAAFAQSTNQRRSCGTFKLGFSYSEHKVNFNINRLPEQILNELDVNRFYDKVKYKDYALTFGYAYNWVFAHNWLASFSLDPGIGYKKSEIQAQKDENLFKHFFRNLNFDVISRAAVVWNNSKYYVGTSLITNTYNYHKTAFSLTSSFGTLNIYAGMNFCLKKKYRKPRVK